MNTDKIRVDKKVVKEAKRMWRVYLNANPDKWANAEMKVLRITSLNVWSLRKHMEDVGSDPHLLQASFLCLTETWLTPEEEREERYDLGGYHRYSFSQGPGKGLIVFIWRGYEPLNLDHHNTSNLQSRSSRSACPS